MVHSGSDKLLNLQTTIQNMTTKNINTPGGYILFCIVALFSLLGLNSFYFILKEALGFNGGTFFFSSSDRFADIIKTAFSYREILDKIPNLSDKISHLSPLYQTYFHNNPYGGISNLSGLTHFHLMPISTLLNIAVGIAIGNGIAPRVLLFALLLSCLFLLFFSTYNIVKSYNKSVILGIVILISYPLIYLITRGNYSALLCGIGVIAFLNSIFMNRKIDLLSGFLFCVAINFRPNAAILLLALPLLFGVKKSVLPVIKIIMVSSSIYFITYFIVHFIYPSYTIATFLKALSVYNKMYVIGSNGDAFNSSLYGLLKCICNNRFIRFDAFTIKWMFNISSLLILFAIARLVFIKKSNNEYYPFIVCSLYILLNPTAGDYHLIIFVVPIFIIYNNFEKWRKNELDLIIITVSAILVLSPKNYLFFRGVSLQVMLNPMIMLFSTLVLFYRNEKLIFRLREERK